MRAGREWDQGPIGMRANGFEDPDLPQAYPACEVKRTVQFESVHAALRDAPMSEVSFATARRSERRPQTSGTRVRVLAVDIGGTNVKILATGAAERRKFPSGAQMTPQQMVRGV